MIYIANMKMVIFIDPFMESSSNSESFGGLFFDSILFNVILFDIRVLPSSRSYMAANVTPVKACTVEDKFITKRACTVEVHDVD